LGNEYAAENVALATVMSEYKGRNPGARR